jgi:DEAD/DEAH box helicase domain-containing protein
VILDIVDLETDPWQRETTGFWLDVPKSILELMRLKGINPAEAIHSAQHAFLNQFPMASDLRTECKAPEKEYKAESSRKRPARLIFYDSVGKCGNVAAKAFDNVYDILCSAFAAIDGCECEDGCSKCVHSHSCKEGNQVSSKLGASIILRGILSLHIAVDLIPVSCDMEFDTIVDAPSVNFADRVEVLCS